MMRLPFTLLVVLAIALGANACGSAERHPDAAAQHPASAARSTGAATVAPTTTTTTASSAPGAKPPKHAPSNDRDSDSDANNDDYAYGRAATAAERRAVAALLQSYYAAGAANDGGAGCALIYSLFAEEIPELYGEGAGPPSLRGTTCAAVMSKLFRQYHQQLTVDHASFHLLAVRIKGRRGIAIMRFKGMAQRSIGVHSEHGTWKMGELLDTKLG